MEGQVVRNGGRRVLDDVGQMDWKRFTIRLIEALRWPAAFIAVAVIFREPVTAFMTAVAAHIR